MTVLVQTNSKKKRNQIILEPNIVKRRIKKDNMLIELVKLSSFYYMEIQLINQYNISDTPNFRFD